MSVERRHVDDLAYGDRVMLLGSISRFGYQRDGYAYFRRESDQKMQKITLPQGGQSFEYVGRGHSKRGGQMSTPETAPRTVIDSPNGVIVFKYALSERQMTEIRERLDQAVKDDKWPIVMTGDGIEWHPIGLALDEEQRDLLKRFHDDGLVWLVNTAVLHPRGWALTIHLDENGEPTGMSIQGDGLEPWVFGAGDNEDVLRRYETAEAKRERAIREALEARQGQG